MTTDPKKPQLDPVRPLPVSTILEGVPGQLDGLLAHLRVVRARVKGGRTPGIATGLPSIDKKLGGLQTGVHLLAASPGAGKTTLALQLARRAAANGASVVYLAFDEGGDRLALKIAAGFAGLKAGEFLSGQVDLDPIDAAIEQYRDTINRIRVYTGPADIGPASVASMLDDARKMDNAEEGLLVVDFLQSWAARLNDTDYRLAVSALVGDLRQVAIGLSVPVLAIAAQNRSESGTPSMSSLRESSDLEYTADSICILADDQSERSEARRKVTLHCVKNRWGALFEAPLVFDAERGVFTETVGAFGR